MEHRGLPNVGQEQVRILGVGPGKRILQFSSLSFDAAVFELVTFLYSGATLCLGTRESIMPGPDLIRLLREQAITNLLLPPSALAALPPADLPALETLILAGEPFTFDLIARWQPGRRMFNFYGPTETTIMASGAECYAGMDRPHIGRAIANFQLYVLDNHMQPVPFGVPGELFVGGVGLARGYWRRPELTQQRFLPDPFRNEPSARLYRTGDLVRYRPDGNLEFCGRIDQQVKLRGFRIELGEIEAVLTSMPEIRDCVAMVREDDPGERRLAAYVVPQPNTAPDAYQIRQLLRETLPDFMVPTAIVVMESFPTHPNGKIDRTQFARPDRTGRSGQGRSGEYTPPRTSVEELLCGIWAKILDLNQVGIHDNFLPISEAIRCLRLD